MSLAGTFPSCDCICGCTDLVCKGVYNRSRQIQQVHKRSKREVYRVLLPFPKTKYPEIVALFKIHGIKRMDVCIYKEPMLTDLPYRNEYERLTKQMEAEQVHMLRSYLNRL